MEIFYLKKSEFLKSVKREGLEYFSDGRSYISDEKYLEHLCGLFLTKFIAKHFYKMDNLDIVIKNNKPFFNGGRLFFSVSHSKDVVLVAFNNSNIGADVEYICERKSFKSIMKRFGEVVENPTVLDFYSFWTLHEAEIKLNADIKSIFSTTLEKDYILTCVSDDAMIGSFKVKNLIVSGVDIDLREEFESPKKCKLVE